MPRMAVLGSAEIGAETVTYDSNIYKYYITYRLIMESKTARDEAAEKLKDQSKGAP